MVLPMAKRSRSPLYKVGLGLNLIGASVLAGTLVAGLNRAVQFGGTLTLVCDHERILKLFRITGLDSVFAIRTSVEDAIAG